MWTDRRAPHLSDRQLLDYLSDGPGGLSDHRADTRLPAHLADCADCTARYGVLAADIGGLADDGAGEADAVFTPERLAHQRERILHRLERHGRRADVFVFPTRGARPATPHRTWQPARWVAAAALGGLAAGLGLGLMLDRRETSDPTPRPAATVASTASAGVAAGAEEELLDAIDAALASRRLPELLALDEITPERVAFAPRLR
jgi:hypothetical protein